MEIEVKEEYKMFKLDEDEEKMLNEWLNEHDKVCLYSGPMNQGAIGGRISYSFTPTSLGCITVVKCACGEEKDLTDVDNW